MSGADYREAKYPLPWWIGLHLVGAFISRRTLSFRQEAQNTASRVRLSLHVGGDGHLDVPKPCLITVNHYTRPGLESWWLALAISSAFPEEITWVMTNAWTYPDRLRSALITPLSRWAFTRTARVFGFFSMPPMPPRPFEMAERARAVRAVYRYVKQNRDAVIGLAPEGGDTPGGIIQMPPSGVGRFISLLSELGCAILPAGVFERGNCLCVQFGAPYRLSIPTDIQRDELDHYVAYQVMKNIAAQLPMELRGQFGAPESSSPNYGKTQ